MYRIGGSLRSQAVRSGGDAVGLSLIHISSEKAGSGKWILAAVAAAALLALVTAGCLSPRLAATEPLPFFALAASSRLLGQAARFDAVLSTACLLYTSRCV